MGRSAGGTRERLRDAIADWLETGREAVLSRLRKAGVPDEVIVPVQTVVERGDRETTFEQRPRAVNPVTTEWALMRIAGPERTAQGPAGEIYGAYGRRCWYQTLSGRPNFETDPVAWVQESLLNGALWQFLRSIRGSLANAATADALTHADNLLTFIEGDSLELRSTLPLDGLLIAESLQAGLDVVMPPLRTMNSRGSSSSTWLATITLS
jgi:hypothetical protein